MYHNGKWGTVCDRGWSDIDASVVCRQLGLGYIGKAVTSAYFGKGSGRIWLNEVSCFGNETCLFDCQHSGIGTKNCVHRRDAGVICGMYHIIVFCMCKL